jgi:hypothetical protein
MNNYTLASDIAWLLGGKKRINFNSFSQFERQRLVALCNGNLPDDPPTLGLIERAKSHCKGVKKRNEQCSIWLVIGLLILSVGVACQLMYGGLGFVFSDMSLNDKLGNIVTASILPFLGSLLLMFCLIFHHENNLEWENAWRFKDISFGEAMETQGFEKTLSSVVNHREYVAKVVASGRRLTAIEVDTLISTASKVVKAVGDREGLENLKGLLNQHENEIVHG